MKILNPKYSKEEIKNIIKRKNAITDRSILSAVLKNAKNKAHDIRLSNM